MNGYLSSASLKRMARGQLLGKYSSVIFIFLFHMITVYFSESLVASVLNPTNVIKLFFYLVASYLVYILSGFFEAGEAYIYLKTASNLPVTFSDLFYCFRNESNRTAYIQIRLAAIELGSMLPALLYSFFSEKDTGLFSIDPVYLLLLLLGIAVSVWAELLFSQSFYIMLDFEDYTAQQAMSTSIRLMKGNMGRLFYMMLSFLPLLFLGVCSLGLGLLWVLPYREAAYANFYLDLIKKSRASATGADA